MKKRIILGIGLLLILLPLLSPMSNITNATWDDPTNDAPNLEAFQAGSKYVYDITTFDYGAGFLEILDLVLPIEAPDFDYGFTGTFEGSEIIAYITAMDSLPLYQYDYWYDYVYENMTMENAFQMFTYFQLNDDLMAYFNASMFSFPDDFTDTNVTNYFNYWAYGDFSQTIDSDEFWNGFNITFSDKFTSGWMDRYDDYPNFWYEWPNENWYSDNITQFGEELGIAIGYDMGYWSCEFSAKNLAWNDSALALDAFYESFFDARLDGFSSGEADYLSTYRIPDSRPPGTPAITTLYDYAYYENYNRWYEMYYPQGYQYQGALENFNRQLYNDIYKDDWDTWTNGYIQGFESGYNNWNGYWAGDMDYPSDYHGSYYWNHKPYDPYFYDPRDAWEDGYNQGIQEGYDWAYEDGFNDPDTYFGSDYLNGMHSYGYEGYQDGFAAGAADNIASNPENPFPISPYPSPSSPFEDGANYAYDGQYYDGYHNGYLYATLVNSPDPMMWMWSNGPFYDMTLPDAEIDIGAGSVFPIAYPLTMFRDLEFTMDLMDEDYEFWWDSGYDYWPFTQGGFVPLQSIFADDTNWISLNDMDVAMNTTPGHESPGINTTYDVANNYFLFELHMDMTEPGMTQDVYWGYNTTDGMLLNISMGLDFYSLTDVYVDMVIELNYSKEEVVTFTDLTSDSWTYFIDDFVFYYDVPPVAPPEFVDGLTQFKTSGLDSIGNDLLTVTVDRYEGLWANYSMELYNPVDPLSTPDIASYSYPMIFPAGPQFLPDWTMLDGMFTTVTSVIGNLDYFIQAIAVLAGQNTNVILSQLVLDPVVDTYYYGAQDVLYQYISIDAAVDFEFGMLNGEYEWEIDSANGWIRGYIWVGFDFTTGQVLGGGVKASLDFTIGQVPDYGMNGMGLEAYLEVIIGSDLATIPHIDALIGSLPLVPEFGLVTILSIIGLAAISSAVIFTKRRK